MKVTPKFQKGGDTFPAGHEGAPDNPIQLQEVVITKDIRPWWKKAIQGTAKFFNDEILLNKNNIRVKNAQKHPRAMDAVQAGGNIAGAVVAAPFALHTLGAAYAVPEIAGAMNLYGAYEGIGRLTSDEGVSKTYNKFKSGDYIGGAKSLGGDVLDVAMSYPAFNAVGRTVYNAAKPSILGYQMSRMPLGEVEAPTLVPQNRFRVGDLEINDPNLNYRQGKEGLIQDFFDTGVVRTQENPTRAIEKAANPQRKFLLTKSFSNPMFRQGSLWYDPELVTREVLTPSMPEMLVTRQPLQFATKTSGPARVDMGGRRIPFSPDQLNPQNTSAFVWQDGYGFRRVPQETTPIIKLEF